MKTVCENDKCTGCMACIDKCPKNAIIIKDTMVAYNAVINENKCISCGLCEKICQNNAVLKRLEPQVWYQGWCSGEKRRCEGSSGGAAMALAAAFIQKGGKVASCMFYQGEFIFKLVSEEKDLVDFAGSKYVKSNPSGIYTIIKEELKKKVNVLFIGLPCQVAAVKQYVGDNLAEAYLTTIDLICHGTPSPKMLEKFLSQYNVEAKRLDNIKFRTKGNFQISDNGKALSNLKCSDAYMISFLSGLSCTDNCYSCAYANIKRISDITLGDSWGTELSSDEWNKGISLILCQTNKGIDLLKTANMELKKVDLNNAIAHNHQLKKPSIAPIGRRVFFENLHKGMSFNLAVFKALPKECISQNIRGILKKIKSGGGQMTYQVTIYYD